MADRTPELDVPIPLRGPVALSLQGAVTNRLPVPRTSFIGRASELRALRALLTQGQARLVTIVGPGGIGKTRTALQLASETASTYAGGAAFISLAAVRDPDLVAPAIAQALEVRRGGGRPVTEHLIATLRDAQALLLLDNFEHVLDASNVVSDLLEHCPGVVMLITSRVRLRLDGEHVYQLPALSCPEDDAPGQELEQAEAVQLFVSRARASWSGFQLTDENVGDVARICRRLDGLPLAIELAAGRIHLLTPSALLARLDRPLRMLTAGPRDGPPRLMTMRDAIAWSYDLLTPAEQSVFRRLAIFIDGFDLSAAEAVLPAKTDSAETLEVVGRLVEASLVRPISTDAGAPRFAMFETIREFALEQLAGFEEEQDARRRHAAHFLAYVDTHSGVPPLPGEAHRTLAIAIELGNIRLALDWFDRHEDGVALLRLAGRLFEYWFTAGLYREGRYWTARALSRDVDAPPLVRLGAISCASALAQHQGDLESSTRLIAEEMPLARRLGDRPHLLFMLMNASLYCYFQGDLDPAAALVHEGLDLVPAAGLDQMTSHGLTGAQMSILGKIAFLRGQHEQAIEWFRKAITNLRAAGYDWAISDVITDLAAVLYLRGADAATAALLIEAFAANARRPDPRTVSGTILTAAGLLGIAGQPALAARLIGAVDTIATAHGLQTAPRERLVLNRCLHSLTLMLGEDELDEERAVGTGWTLNQAVYQAAAAMAAVHAELTPNASGSQPSLTIREREVLAYLAAGLTDREIAGAIFVSLRTVHTHVTHILAKLGVANRRQAVIQATKLGILSAS